MDKLITQVAVAAVAVVGLILGVAGLATESDEVHQIGAFVAHCDDALSAARAQHEDLRVDAAAAPDDEALRQRVEEDAERDVCGVKVAETVARPGVSFSEVLARR